MNHRKLPLNFFGKSDADFQKFHEKHFLKVEDTRLIENQGKTLLCQKKYPSISQLRNFSNQVFSWGGTTGSRVRGKVSKFPDSSSRLFFLLSFHYIHQKEFFLAALSVQAIKNLGGKTGGLSYASKHLRFLWPERCGVLDSTVEKYLAFSYPTLPKLYLFYIYSNFCVNKADELSKRGLLLGDCLPTTPNYPVYSNAAKPWKAADVDMAVFAKLSFASKRKGWYP